MPSIRYRWVILILTYICLLTYGFTLQSVPPILPLIIEAQRLTHAEAGLLMSLFSVPGILLGILAGSLSDRLGAFKIGVFSFILVIIGGLTFATSNVFLLAGLGRIIAGIGAITLVIISLQTLSRWFTGREIGTVMGIFNTSYPVSIILPLLTFGILGENFGWRMPILITIVTCTLGLIAFLILYKPPPNLPQEIAFEKEEGRINLPSNLFTIGLPIWLVGVCWMLFNASLISFLTFAPDFLVSMGHSISYAGFLTSLIMWGTLPMSLIIGRMVDRIGNNELFIAIAGILFAGSIYFVSRSTEFLFPMICVTFAAAIAPVPIMAFPSKLVKPKDLGLGFGIITALNSTGMVFGPYIAGLIRDITGSYEMSLTFMSMMAMLLTIFALLLRAKMKTYNIPA